MDFALTEEQQSIQKLSRDFADTEIRAAQAEMDETHEFPYALWERWSELGMAGIMIPEEYGGTELDTLTYILAIEEVARVSQTFALIWQVHVLVAKIYERCASEELKNHYLPIYARGEKLGAFALTEPGAGSDAAGLRTKAVRDGNHWVINGTKTFISNAGTEISDGLVLMAATGKRADGTNEISSFSIPHKTDGYKLGQSWDKMAWFGMDNRELVFEDCRLDASRMIGDEGAGLRQALGGLNVGRIVFGALGTGLIQACFEESLAYAKDRKQFGRSLSSFQLMQAKIADMAANAEACRQFTRYAAYLDSKNIPCHKEAAMVKFFCTDLATKATLDAYQIHGGYGFMKEYAVNRFFREGKMLEIGEGTNEIQRLLVAKELGCDDWR